MFRMRLQALEHPNPSSVNAEDRKVFANTVLWLEDQVIRFYTIEDRANLRMVENIKLWEGAYQQYKNDLCAPQFHSASEDLFWLLSYGIRLTFLDSPEKFAETNASKLKNHEQITKNWQSPELKSLPVPVSGAEKGNTCKLDQTNPQWKSTSRTAVGTARKKETNDPLKKGLSGAGIKWYRRFILQGYSREDARKKVAERQTKQTKKHGIINHSQEQCLSSGQFAQNEDSKSFLLLFEDCLKTEGNKRAHPHQEMNAKRCRTSSMGTDFPQSGPYTKGLTAVRKPSVTRQMKGQKKSNGSEHNQNELITEKGSNEIVLLIADKGHANGVIAKKKWRQLKIAMLKTFISLLDQFPGPIPSFREAQTAVLNGKLVICENKRSAEMFQVAVSKLGALWHNAQLIVCPYT